VDTGPLLYTGTGLATLAAALLPRLLNRAPISMPMLLLGAGALTFSLVEPLPDPDPIRHSGIVVHLTELCVIVSLMGAGLALNRVAGVRAWSSTWRLLGITMPLSILAVGLLGWGLLGLGIATSILLAGALAPTDPVLASEVQVAEPAQNPTSKQDEARFALTSEAGLNDGLAFPFVHAAIAISVAGAAPAGWLPHWLGVDVGWRLAAGVAVGLLTGWLLGKLFFSAPSKKFRLAEHAEGFVALAATFLAYGLTELVNGYGFIAVFVCACAIRASERHHGYHRVLHSYVEQGERMLTVLIIFLLGGAAATGLFAGVAWHEILTAAVILFVVRPLAGWLGLLRSRATSRERLVIAFFGVRGVGSLFYITYALQAGQFADPAAIWRIVGLVVVGSIMVHGLSASPIMYLLDRGRARTPQPSREATDQSG
jgi:NhaP-type Na+/H+ or K+/H+ antiporter